MNISIKNDTRATRQGFTLVEVLVSSLLTLMVMGMLFGVLMGTINAWEGGTSRLKSAGDARLALDILKTDLESLVARQTQYNQEWLVSTPIDIVPGVSATWLTFFAPSLDRPEDQDGDIVALSYRLALQDPISAANRPQDQIFALYKAMTTTVEAFNEVLGLQDIHAEYWDKSGTPIPSPTDRRGFLAPNVVGFDVTWWVRHSTPGTEVYERFDSSHSVRLNNTLEIYKEGNPVPIVESGKIEVVDVTLTSISDEGMRRFSFLGNASELPSIINEFGRTHTVRIPINY